MVLTREWVCLIYQRWHCKCWRVISQSHGTTGITESVLLEEEEVDLEEKKMIVKEEDKKVLVTEVEGLDPIKELKEEMPIKELETSL